MAKFNYFEVKCGVYEIDGKEVVSDSVRIQIGKKVNTRTMGGIKAEEYDIDIADIPYLFNVDDKIPAMNGADCSRRIECVKTMLYSYLGLEVKVEEISKGKRRIITSLEFGD